MLPQLLEAQRDFFAAQTVLVNMLIDERNDKKKIVEAQSNEPKTIKPIKKLTRKDDFLEWRTNLFNALKTAGVENHILRNILPPCGKANYEKWESERAEVDFYLQNSVDQYVWILLQTKGWATTTRNPKVTFDKLTEHFF